MLATHWLWLSHVRVDQKIIGNLTLGSYAIVNLQPGTHEVVLEPGSFTWSAAY